MGKMGIILLFYVILIVSFVGLYVLIQSLSGFNNTDLKDVTLAIGGGLLGGYVMPYFKKHSWMNKNSAKFLHS